MSGITTQAGFIDTIEATGKASDNIIVDYFAFLRGFAEVEEIDATTAGQLATLAGEITTLLAAAPLNATDTATLREKTALLVRAAHGEPKFPTTTGEVDAMLEGSANYMGQAALAITNRNAIAETVNTYPDSVIESFLPDV